MGKNLCSGCYNDLNPSDDSVVEGQDDLGTGTFCSVCWNLLEKNRANTPPWSDASLLTSEQLQRAGSGKLDMHKELRPEQAKLPKLSPAKPPSHAGSKPPAPQAGKGGYSNYPSYSNSYPTTANSYAPKCRHMEPIDMGPGQIFVSSSMHDSASLSTEADAAVFFDKGWDNKLNPVIAVWQEGSNGIELPTPPKMLGPVIYVPWRDQGPPPAFIDIYVDWVAGLVNDGKTVQVGCIGGHGRTGTFIALVALAAGVAKTADEAFFYVWTRVCTNSIETQGQEEAIFNFAAERLSRTEKWSKKRVDQILAAVNAVSKLDEEKEEKAKDKGPAKSINVEEGTLS